MAEMNWQMPFKRLFVGNLDADYSFKTKQDLDDFLNIATRYSGQLAYCEETEKVYVLSQDMTKWNEIGGSGNGIKIVDDYSKLSTTLTDYEINYCLNDYIDTSVTPNETYSKGFYLYDKVSKVWNPISVTGKIASNTTLGNVIIKKDGGIGVDSNGNIWIDSYSKTETTDPDTGKVTTIETNGGITTITVTDPNTGETEKTTTVGGITTSETTDPITGETTTSTTVGDITTTTKTDTTTGETTTSTELGGITVETKDDGNGNISETTNLGGAELKEEINADGSKYTTIGDKVVEGSKTETTTNTTTDPDTGNTITETVTTVTTPNGSEQTKETIENDVATGNTITTIENIKGGSDGGDVGSASGDRTTTTTDSTGTTIDETTEDVSYTNGEEDQWLTQEEANQKIDDLGNNLGWDF